MRRVVGVDDAGRGSVIGPLVMAGVMIAERKLDHIVKQGVRDSKKMSPKMRLRVYNSLLKSVDDFDVVMVEPEEIDVYVRGVKYRRLNYLEAKTAAQVINVLDPDVAYVDASDVNERRHAEQIREHLDKDIELVCVHNAEEKYPVVAAASIVAKVTRDSEVQRLKLAYGDFGSGYPSDPRTRLFLKSWLDREEALPAIVRKKWKTIERLRQSKS